MQPLAVLIHVPDVELGLSWYQKAFPDAVARKRPFRTVIQFFSFVNHTMLSFKTDMSNATLQTPQSEAMAVVS
ncbi:hypothetical protein N9850_10355 [Granulosicoccus sp.]|nr:hypothetical protein [Granulosicoccus sp.]MDB4224162.1 hypothetical protein [Granulosicoccus sp.]